MNLFDGNLRVLNFTHNDLDGAVSAIILANVYTKVDTYPIGKAQLKDVVSIIKDKSQDYDIVIFTDICPTDYIDDLKTCPIDYAVIDHHETEISAHNPAENRFVIPGLCGAKLTYDMYSVHFAIDALEHLVDLSNDFDMWTLSNPDSVKLDHLFRIYGMSKFIRLMHDGFEEFTPSEESKINSYVLAAKDYVGSLKIRELAGNGAFVEASKFYTDLMIELDKKYTWYAICHRKQDGSNTVSLRYRKGNLDIGALAKETGFGGGHPEAAGLLIPVGFDVTPVIAIIADKIAGEA